MRILLTILLCALTTVARAQPPADPITGSAAFGYLATSGNTESTNANGTFALAWDPGGLWTHEWNALAVGASTDDVSTAEAYAANYKALRELSELSYLFGAADWRKDRFSAYDSQLSETVGYGRRVIDNDRHTLAIEGGGGAKQSRLVDGTNLDEAIVRGALDYVLRLGDNSEFNQRFLTEVGDDNRYTESLSALRARIVGNFAIVVSYTVKNNSDVPPGIEETDTFTAVSLEYGF